MSRFVLDTSVALAWCFEDETSSTADRVLDSLESSEALVPAIWPIEVGSALLAGERRKRITAPEISTSLALLRKLNIQLDPEGLQTGVGELVRIARSNRLSVYDAAYLALAMREGLPLATLDKPLAKAARSVGVRLLA